MIMVSSPLTAVLVFYCDVPFVVAVHGFDNLGLPLNKKIVYIALVNYARLAKKKQTTKNKQFD